MKKIVEILRSRFLRVEHHKRNMDGFDSIETAFYDKKQFEEYKRNGFIVLPFLNDSEINQLKKGLDLYLSETNNPVGSLFYTSGRDTSLRRNLAKQTSWTVIQPLLSNVLNVADYSIEGCTWLLKPVGDESELWLHQDSSLIDETKSASFYGWIPIQDVSVQNGCMNVIPGSHLWGNHYRSLDVSWSFEPYINLLSNFSIPIEMKAGEILLFDSALIHGSYPNHSNSLRAAVNLFCKPQKTDFVHYMTFPDTPKGRIESYKITMDFVYNEDYRKRPDTEKFPFSGYVDEIEMNLSKKKIRKLCNPST